MGGGSWLVSRRRGLQRWAVSALRLYYNGVWGTQIGEGTRISLSAKIDKANPTGVVIGQYTAIAYGASILTHDFVNNRHVETRIGSRCFIGGRAIIMPGVTIGDHCIVGAGAVVSTNLPSGCVAVGNPARVVERGIHTIRYGIRRPALAAETPPAVSPPAGLAGEAA